MGDVALVRGCVRMRDTFWGGTKKGGGLDGGMGRAVGRVGGVTGAHSRDVSASSYDR